MKLGVIGGGAWGTALAQVASAGGRETMLWALEDTVVQEVNRSHHNPVFLPGVALNESIRATGSLGDLDGCDAWLVVTPAQHMRAVLEQTPDCDRPMVLCSKGIEEKSGEPGTAEKRFWRETVEGRRAALLPFVWSTIATKGQIFGDPSKNSRAYAILAGRPESPR